MTPAVSVIIPTYNRKELLLGAIDSVVKQTVAPLEVFVVDDGSTDGTATAVERIFGNRVEYIPLEHTGLPARARNAGLERARGTYVAFCDSDDTWLPHKLETQIGRMKDRKCNCSCSDAAFKDGEAETYLQHYRFRYENLATELHRENFFIASSVVLERSTIGTKRFDERSGLRGYEDYHFWLSLARKLRIDFVAEPLLVYHRHAESLSAALQRRDAVGQMSILLSSPSYVHHPIIWLMKMLRSGYHRIR